MAGLPQIKKRVCSGENSQPKALAKLPSVSKAGMRALSAPALASRVTTAWKDNLPW